MSYLGSKSYEVVSFEFPDKAHEEHWNIINSQNVQGHTDLITDLIMIPKLQYLASCSLDKQVILWDTITLQKRRTYKQHTMGVVSLSFNPEYILLFSAGFDHEICVLNPYIDQPVYKIQAHNAPIVCIKAIQSTPQLVSCDSDGIVKVWDIRTFKCVQTIASHDNLDIAKFSLAQVLAVWEHRRIIFAGSEFIAYEYDKVLNPSLADDSPAIKCLYNERYQEFLTPVSN